MKHCPNCHYEYEDWATTCSDCEVALEPGPPPEPQAPPVIDYGQFRDWVILSNVPNTMMGTLLKDQLEQAGIPVLMKRAHATDVAEWTHNDYAWQDLYVPRRFLVRARRLIDSPPGRRYPADDPVEEDWADEDEDDDLALEANGAAGDVLGVAPPNYRSDWYLVDSARPTPPPEAGAAALLPRAPALPTLSHYREAIAQRKDHLPPPPADRVVPFPGSPAAPPAVRLAADDDPDEGYAARSAPSAWTHSRIYRILIGLLFLAWTLPFLLQMLQYFRDAFWRLFP